MKDVDGEIARRAYRRYQERGGGERRELDDWLAAQREVEAELEPDGARSDGDEQQSRAGSRKRR
jgi:hypothetical protein